MTKKLRIAGLWGGHDCSFCILEDGIPVIHAEYERYIREKEPKGDAASFLRDIMGDKEAKEIDVFTSCYPSLLLTKYRRSFDWLLSDKKVNIIGHHQSHAAHAFFSSNIDRATIITIDGGGVEDANNTETATTVWSGKGNKIEHLQTYRPSSINIGGLWTRVTRYIFKLQNGWPRGHQAGSVMAMAALGDRKRFFEDFVKMLTTDVASASMKPPGQPPGAYTGNDPVHPYLDRWAKIAEKSEQDKYDLAASLQSATEYVIRSLVASSLEADPGSRNLCIAGGVALNSVAIGKIRSWFPGQIDQVFVPPVPYDGGLSIGAAQYTWHHVMDNPRIQWEDSFTPYLGETHNTKDIRDWLNTPDIKDYLVENEKSLITQDATDVEVIDHLLDGKIVAVFNGPSESGRRALGNRSILADPRNPNMKDMINEKVKHRQWFRPFAPSIMREHVPDWFIEDVDSPYMTHVIPFKEEVREKVPAVVHFDGTARLQTVTSKDNPWYYNFLQLWLNKSGVPIILNTSFNDREPICETPEHALKCFLGTDIDFLYFPKESLLVSKND